MRKVHEIAASPDASPKQAEQDFLAKRLRLALDRAREALEPEERLILKMRFEDRLSIADTARALGRSADTN